MAGHCDLEARPMFDPDLLTDATRLLDRLRTARLSLATAESCTGGLIAALLTEIAGASDVIDRGFVTYSNAAKTELIGVPAALIDAHGAVSREVAVAMAEGALGRTCANAGGALAISVTGVAGPGGGSVEKPVGLVHIAVARTGHATRHRQCRFGDIGRDGVRMATVRAALEMVDDAAGAR
jgi:nicotinamide-nucleotide amidase